MSVNNRKLRQKLIENVVKSSVSQTHLSDQQLKAAILRSVMSLAAEKNTTLSDKRDLVEQIFADMRGLDILQELFADSSITEIMVNGPNNIFFEKNGRISQAKLKFEDHEHLRSLIDRCFGRANRLISEQFPIAGIKLEDGSRVQAVLAPAAAEGPYISIRRYGGIKPDMESLIGAGFLNEKTAEYLKNAINKKKSIFISGGTGTGKTTFLNALSSLIPNYERVITIEEEAELDLQGLQNTVSLQARLPGPDDKGAITLTDLIRLSLRLRPDRIIVGEVRGGEAYDMIQAMHTGHPGSMSTGHGNSAEDMLERLALMLIMHTSLPWDACRKLISMAADIVIQLERTSDGHRHIAEIIEVGGLKQNCFIINRIYSRLEADTHISMKMNKEEQKC